MRPLIRLCLTTLLLSLIVAGNLEAGPLAQTTIAERCEETEDSLNFDMASINASIERAFKDGRAPRIFYALGKDRRNALKTVLAAGDNPNVCHAGFSPLMMAVASNDIEEVAILLRGGAHPDKPLDGSGGSPMMFSLGMGRYAIVQKLLQHGASPLQVTDGGSTTLHELAINTPAPGSNMERLALAREFIVKGVSVNAATQGGSTPLMLSAASGDINLVMLLLKHGAIANTKNQRGQSALDIAKRKQRNDIVKLLQEYGAKQ